MLGGEIDVGVRAGKPHRKPLLTIASISPSHHPLGDLVRHNMMQPAPAFPKDIGSVSADLLAQLTQRRLARSFASIDAALRHLPFRQPGRHPDTVADERETVSVEEHDPNPQTVTCMLVLTSAPQRAQ